MAFLTGNQDLHLIAVSATKRTVQSIFCHGWGCKRFYDSLSDGFTFLLIFNSL
jgi:hypothetical protein